MFRINIHISQTDALPAPFYEALERWRQEVIKIMREERISWFSKLVYSTFVYDGESYIVDAQDVFKSETLDRCPRNYLDAVLELAQGRIAADLDALGAEKIFTCGFLD